MKIIKKYRFNRKEKGGFLLELMIGVLLSSITVLAVTTVYTKMETEKRDMTQKGKTTSNAAIAMYPIQQAAKASGYGLNGIDVLGCKVKAYNQNRGTNQEFEFTLAPVVITPGATEADSDKIDFMSGNSSAYFAPVLLTSNSNAAAAVFKVDNRFGFREKDLIIVAEHGKDCILRQVTEVPGVGGIKNGSGNGGGNNANSGTDNIIANPGKDGDYNKPGGMGISYNIGAKIFNLGSEPDMVTYELQGEKLIEVNQKENTQKAIAGDVIRLKAQYGFDKDNNGDVEEWTNVLGAATNYKFLKGLRIGMLIRSPLKQYGKAECNASSKDEYNWFGGAMNISEYPDYKCFSYRVIQTTIPLRNLMWTN